MLTEERHLRITDLVSSPGPVGVPNAANDHVVAEATIRQSTQKQQIATRTASLVDDGDTIAPDSGTTILKMCDLLHEREITITTAPLPVKQDMIEVLTQAWLLGERQKFSGRGVMRVTDAFAGLITDQELGCVLALEGDMTLEVVTP